MDDQPQAKERALLEALERVNKGIAHISVAVVYPATLRQVPFASPMDSLAHSTFRVAVCSEAGEAGWTEGGLDYLANLLRRTFHQLVKKDVVSKTVETLNGGINEFEHSMKDLLRNFLELVVSYGLELGKQPTKGDFEEVNRRLREI